MIKQIIRAENTDTQHIQRWSLWRKEHTGHEHRGDQREQSNCPDREKMHLLLHRIGTTPQSELVNSYHTYARYHKMDVDGRNLFSP